MKKNVNVLLGILLSSIIIVDTYLLFNAKVPITNQLYRYISGAPEVHMKGKLLLYRGALHNVDLVQYIDSDQGLQLYKDLGVPDRIPKLPPYLYVKKDHKIYQYKIPKSPFTIG
ncbi:hypothetical protein [Paenibacillus sp. YYML68]|uniref:hypothetical protein n=1 Tax=Paenibacillus sp. YYML68 TaxID=2909250 RepID=UPI0024927407|nr:hypothetical protein [Paenibacillus sp. YYML68]